jgi:hypothetical protein
MTVRLRGGESLGSGVHRRDKHEIIMMTGRLGLGDCWISTMPIGRKNDCLGLQYQLDTESPALANHFFTIFRAS